MGVTPSAWLAAALRYFRPEVYVLLALLAGGLVVYAGCSWVTAVHRARQAEQRVCEAELRALLARQPAARSWVRPADPCVALRIVTR